MRELRILATQYSLQTKSIELYVSGCAHHPCKGCHNPETWDFEQGNLYSPELFSELKRKAKSFKRIIKNVMIFGGEPLDSELESMLKDLSKLGLPIWLFTHYDLNEAPSHVKQYCEYIKCGEYKEELATDDNEQYGIKLATSNQNIYKRGIDY